MKITWREAGQIALGALAVGFITWVLLDPSWVVGK
jgi:hypothetical protein